MAFDLIRFTRGHHGCLVFASLTLASCAAPPKPPETPPAPVVSEEAPVSSAAPATPAPIEPEVAPTRAPATVAAFPSECADGSADGVCSPPMPFAKEVCGGFAKPDVALLLFAKGSPWTRAYLRLNIDAWYTGSRSARVALKFDEEVIVLHHPNAPGGIIVNGSGAPFDVMRLDGRCATLTGEEVTLKRPPAPKHPVVPWRQLDPRTREVLLSDPTVAQALGGYEDCVEGSPACSKAGGKLTTAILDFMARGGRIPVLATNR